jgi:hypothetical protein
MSPLCESYLLPEQTNQMEPFYPLHVFVCDRCFLVQLEQYVSADDIFTEYAYFSSYSKSWLEHAKRYTDLMCSRFPIDGTSLVVELASNDGYLLQYFVEKKIPVLGIEPAANVAKVAEEKGVPSVVRFFGRELAEELAAQGKKADLLLGNNVLAQVPDVRDFVAGMKILLKPKGVITLEFPHLLRLMEENQFDTIYHEHFSYFSFLAVTNILEGFDLKIFDVEELPTHGGSLRVYACHKEDMDRAILPHVAELERREEEAGVGRLATYSAFAEQVRETKRALLGCLIQAKREGKSVAGYGAPGKSATLLNYCGIGTDFIDYTVDRNPYKHGRFTPGTHIPIFPPERILETHPDYLLILPWNLRSEIMEQMTCIRDWGGKFIVPIPEAKIVS